jgi:hypothetical protein
MVFIRFRILLIVLALIGVVNGLISCKDNPYLSTVVIPLNNQLNVKITDTFSISASTIVSDKVLTNGLSRYVLGQTQNATFGKTTASLYTSFSLPSDQLEGLGIIDSAVINLQYAGIFGDTLTNHSLLAYEVDPNSSQRIMDNQAYYSDAQFPIIPTIIGSLSNFKFHPKDSVAVVGPNLTPHLRIRITDLSFLYKIQSQTASTGFLNNTAFHNVVNGIYIKVISQNGNVMMYIDNSASSITGLVVYHHLAGGAPTATIFRLGTATVNAYEHTRNATNEVTAHLGKTNDSVIYLQGLGGLQARIQIPYLNHLKNVLINKAEIIFEDVNAGATSIYTPPASLYIYRKDSITQTLEDVTLGSPFSDVTTGNYFGGARKTDYTYHFNIARYIQKVVDNQTAPFDGFYLNILGNSLNPNQIKLGGGELSSKKIKLKITFTQLN